MEKKATRVEPPGEDEKKHATELLGQTECVVSHKYKYVFKMRRLSAEPSFVPWHCSVMHSIGLDSDGRYITDER